MGLGSVLRLLADNFLVTFELCSAWALFLISECLLGLVVLLAVPPSTCIVELGCFRKVCDNLFWGVLVAEGDGDLTPVSPSGLSCSVNNLELIRVFSAVANEMYACSAGLTDADLPERYLVFEFLIADLMGLDLESRLDVERMEEAAIVVERDSPITWGMGQNLGR